MTFNCELADKVSNYFTKRKKQEQSGFVSFPLVQCVGWIEGGREYPPGGVSTPGHGQGEGPVGYKFPPSGGDAGDNGRGRSEAESSGRVPPSSLIHT